jgi:hypothetical protein
MLKKLFNDVNYLTIRSLEHAYDIKFTPLEIERLLKKLNDEYVDNNGSRTGEHPKPPRSKI